MFPLRGITYVQREVERIERDHRRKATTHYPLLSRQYTYGMMGIYGAAAVEGASPGRQARLHPHAFARTPTRRSVSRRHPRRPRRTPRHRAPYVQ